MHSPARYGSDNILTAENTALVLIDYQSLLLLGVQSHDRMQLTNNIVGLARASRAFDVPTILTTVAAGDFGGPLLMELKGIFPDVKVFDRTLINAWEHEEVLEGVKEIRRKKLVIAGLCTEVSLALPALSALEEGYSVYFVSDASGAVTADAHESAVQQLIQAGARPRTWQQVMFAWQRDWARLETAGAVREIIHCHGGAFPPSVFLENVVSGLEQPRHLPTAGRGMRPIGMER
jgi:nicotinamidase-related amidase